MTQVELKIVNPFKESTIPKYATPDSAGVDLSFSALDAINILPGETVLLSTNLAIQLPPNTQAEVRSRSGMALKRSLHVLNSPGTIDRDYTGEIGVIMHNASTTNTQTILPGDRIAQLVIMPYIQVQFNQVNEFAEITQRGDNGLGSSGK